MKKCQKPAAFRYTWPGRNEERICLEHSGQLASVADAIGVPLQLITLSARDMLENNQCHQVIKEEAESE